MNGSTSGLERGSSGVEGIAGLIRVKVRIICQSSEPVYLPQPLGPRHQLRSHQQGIRSSPHHPHRILRAVHPALRHQEYPHLSCLRRQPLKGLKVNLQCLQAVIVDADDTGI